MASSVFFYGALHEKRAAEEEKVGQTIAFAADL